MVGLDSHHLSWWCNPNAFCAQQLIPAYPQWPAWPPLPLWPLWLKQPSKPPHTQLPPLWNPLFLLYLNSMWLLACIVSFLLNSKGGKVQSYYGHLIHKYMTFSHQMNWDPHDFVLISTSEFISYVYKTKLNILSIRDSFHAWLIQQTDLILFPQLRGQCINHIFCFLQNKLLR